MTTLRVSNIKELKTLIGFMSVNTAFTGDFNSWNETDYFDFLADVKEYIKINKYRKLLLISLRTNTFEDNAKLVSVSIVFEHEAR